MNSSSLDALLVLISSALISSNNIKHSPLVSQHDESPLAAAESMRLPPCSSCLHAHDAPDRAMAPRAWELEDADEIQYLESLGLRWLGRKGKAKKGKKLKKLKACSAFVALNSAIFLYFSFVCWRRPFVHEQPSNTFLEQLNRGWSEFPPKCLAQWIETGIHSVQELQMDLSRSIMVSIVYVVFGWWTCRTGFLDDVHCPKR